MIKQKSNIFSIDFDNIESILEDANAILIENSEQIILKASAYPNDIYDNAKAEELKIFLQQLRSQAKDLAQARLSDGRSFSEATKVIKAWFGKVEDRLKIADKRISQVLSSYTSKLYAQAEQVRLRNEEIQRLLTKEDQKKNQLIDQDINNKLTFSEDAPNLILKNELEENIEVLPEIPNVAMVWQIKDFDIKQLDLEKLRNYLTPFAINNAINNHIKSNGPHQITGVEYELVVAKKL